jgi:hypothetical protein
MQLKIHCSGNPSDAPSEFECEVVPAGGSIIQGPGEDQRVKVTNVTFVLENKKVTVRLDVVRAHTHQ